jgi:hypothetical protein
MKPLKFVGSSLDDLRNFPSEARRHAGFELDAVQRGLDPSDWKPMNTIAQGYGKYAFMCLVNGVLFISQNWLTRFLFCTLFRKRPGKPGVKI